MTTLDTKRILITLFKIQHEVMLNITESDDLGTVGKEFRENVDVAEASSNVLALQISKKGK